MKYNGKEIVHMNNADLMSVAFTLNDMENKSSKAKNDPRYAKKFKNQPPKELNPDFVALKAEVYNEIKRRKL